MSETLDLRKPGPGHEVERIETISRTMLPWGVRLAFGFVGILLLVGAFAVLETITVQIWLALIVGSFALAVTFIVMGRVSTYPSAGQSVFVVDRFSGEVELCTRQGCRVLPREGVFLTGPKVPAIRLPAK
jgi:hypothetical protein